MTRKPPQLFRSDRTGRVYIVTSYRDLPGGTIEARTKYDVTDQYEALAAAGDPSPAGVVTPSDLADYHRARSTHGQGEAWCALCRPAGWSVEGWYSWPCPVWLVAHPEEQTGRAVVEGGYALDLWAAVGGRP